MMFRLTDRRLLRLVSIGLLGLVGMVGGRSVCASSWVPWVLPREIEAVALDESVALVVTQGSAHAYGHGQGWEPLPETVLSLGHKVAPRVAVCWGQTKVWAFSWNLNKWTTGESLLLEQVVDCKAAEDVAVVQTGTRIFAYSALTGNWENRRPTQSIDSVEVGEQIALVRAGREIWGYSAFFDEWTGDDGLCTERQ
jgi:hypothetical protein